MKNNTLIALIVDLYNIALAQNAKHRIKKIYAGYM
jgi:hypothetical protein